MDLFKTTLVAVGLSDLMSARNILPENKNYEVEEEPKKTGVTIYVHRRKALVVKNI